jgi:hypothetical protein
MTREELITELAHLQEMGEEPGFDLIRQAAEILGMPLAVMVSHLLKTRRSGHWSDN